MPVRHEERTPEHIRRQRALDRSWATAQDVLRDPQRRSQLESAIARMNESTDDQTLSQDEFLQTTEPLVE